MGMPQPWIPQLADLSHGMILPADQAAVSVGGAVGFLVAMSIVGYGMGKFLGDEYRLFGLFNRFGQGRKAATVMPAEGEARLEAALEAISQGEPIPDLPDLLSRIASPNDVDALFTGDRLQRLVASLQEPAAQGDPARKDRLDEIYQLICHVCAHAPEELRIPLAATLGRILPWHRGLAPWLLAVCGRHPDLWNDLQGRFDEAASRDPLVQRFLETHASPDKAFVRRANDIFMNEMQRFRRLCEDYANISAAIPRPELDQMLAHEFLVLERSGGTSRRFMWLPSNVRVVVKRMTPEHMDALLDGVRAGIAGACALATRGVLVWATNGERERAEEVVDALAEAAPEHLPAADALFGMLHGIRPTRAHPRLSPDQSAVRRRAFDRLQELARSSFEVRSMLQTHGLMSATYNDPGEDEATLESTNF